MNTLQPILVGLATLGVAACHFCFDTIEGNGVAASEDRVLTSFGRVVVRGSTDVLVVVNPDLDGPPIAHVSGDENLLVHLETHVSGDTLRIETDVSFDAQVPFEVVVETPYLRDLVLEGSANVRADGVCSDQLDVAVVGSGDVAVAGKVGRLRARVTGSGDVAAQSLRAVDAQVVIEGSGDAAVCVTGALVGHIAGSGSIRYGCGPTLVDVDVSGSGDVAAGF